MSAPWSSQLPLAVLGTGAALPGAPITTETLVGRMVDRFGYRTPRRALAIADRLGIRTRHHARDWAARHEGARAGDGNADLAARAVRQALAAAGVEVSAVAYLIGHTTSPESALPGNIALVADRLGYAGPHIELRQACTGFANALMVASGLIALAPGRPVVIVGSETGSLWFDPDRLDEPGQLVNLIQMGDGAGAIVLGAGAGDGARINAAWYGACGLGRTPGISLMPGASAFDHDFESVRANGPMLFEAGEAAARQLGAAPEAADYLLPHQVSGRIGAQLTRALGLPPQRAFVNADVLGNTGSAAIWLALAGVRAIARAGERALALGAEASKYMYGGFAYTHG